MTVDIVEKVHCTVFLCDCCHVQNKDRDLRRQIDLPIIFA